MRRLSLVVAFVLPVVATSAALVGARANQSGGRAAILLTERELVPASRTSDNSAAVLRLEWQGRRRAPDWMTRAKLVELGFNCDVDPVAPEAAQHYRRAFARDTFVVLEFDGPAWQQAAQHQEAAADSAAQRRPPIRETASHLAAIDAAPDALTLATRYPDASRYLITAATVRLVLARPPGAPPRLGGLIVELTPGQIHVPSLLIPRLSTGRYSAAVRYGRRDEPWVETITPR